MVDATSLAQRIGDVLVKKGFEPAMRHGSDAADRYEEQTGAPAPPEVVELWSVLGGRDILGMCLEGANSAGLWCAARASEAESSGPGVPYEELDGSASGAVRMVWWDRGWCPLHATVDNAIAVDSHPGAEGRAGQVVYCDMDVYSDREVVWGSVADFLRDVLAVVSSDGLVVEDGHGLMTHTDNWTCTVLMAVLETGRARRDGRPVPLIGFTEDSTRQLLDRLHTPRESEK
ncbi:SMI1/KNR4 family protein [Nocardia salmonicida]|uniref:SMI1/KNR4 family protein n=1 Tax=Nocardia salmonicida TaxID=53431 RepID=UPI0033F15666